MIKRFLYHSSFVLGLTLIFLAYVSAPVSAQSLPAINLSTECSNTKVPGSSVCTTTTTTSQIVSNVADAAVAFLATVAVIVIIVAGIRMMAGGANPQTVKTSKEMILYAVIGLVVSGLSYALVKWVTSLF